MKRFILTFVKLHEKPPENVLQTERCYSIEEQKNHLGQRKNIKSVVAEASWEAYLIWKKLLYFHYRILNFTIIYLRLYTVDI